jgi:hypothetical protein
MKLLLLLLAIAVGSAVLFKVMPTTTSKKPIARSDNNEMNAHPVVIELFTSQGCSSCPPADKLLSKYISQENVFALSFHVDYWNRLGWKDPFSNSDYSARQSEYAASFGSGNVYTPQAVINGEKEFVGSDEDKIDNALKIAHQEKNIAQVKIDSVWKEGNDFHISYSTTGELNNQQLNIALVQKKVTTSIKRGENQGVELTNYNVVRSFKTVSRLSNLNNNITISYPDQKSSEVSVIAYLQNVTTKLISAAAQKAF